MAHSFRRVKAVPRAVILLADCTCKSMIRAHFAGSTDEYKVPVEWQNDSVTVLRFSGQEDVNSNERSDQ